jgi:hypothetical protein
MERDRAAHVAAPRELYNNNYRHATLHMYIHEHVHVWIYMYVLDISVW